ncbi:MAG TPA: PilZ domain-containing protein [Acidobacteriaceae bacterium]
MAERQKPGDKDAVRTAVRFPIELRLHLKTEDGMVDAITKDISSNGLLFVSTHLPKIGSSIEFTMDMPSEVMGWASDVSIHCMGRVVRHQHSGQESMAAAVIDEYFLKA